MRIGPGNLSESALQGCALRLIEENGMTAKVAATWMGSAPLLMVMIALFLALHQRAGSVPPRSSQPREEAWIHSGFGGFAQGRFDDGGSNLYVNAHGSIKMI